MSLFHPKTTFLHLIDPEISHLIWDEYFINWSHTWSGASQGPNFHVNLEIDDMFINVYTIHKYFGIEISFAIRVRRWQQGFTLAVATNFSELVARSATNFLAHFCLQIKQFILAENRTTFYKTLNLFAPSAQYKFQPYWNLKTQRNVDRHTVLKGIH